MEDKKYSRGYSEYQDQKSIRRGAALGVGLFVLSWSVLGYCLKKNVEYSNENEKGIEYEISKECNSKEKVRGGLEKYF